MKIDRYVNGKPVKGPLPPMTVANAGLLRLARALQLRLAEAEDAKIRKP